MDEVADLMVDNSVEVDVRYSEVMVRSIEES